MNRRDAVVAMIGACAGALSVRVAAQARRGGEPFHIGLLPDLTAEELDWFGEAMKRLDWVAGRDFTFFESSVKSLSHVPPYQVRMATATPQFRQESIRQNTERLIARRPDVILATSTAYAIAARRVSDAIPVVMWTGGYPVEAGLAQSLAHPGGNVTGVSIFAGTGTWGKLLEFLRDVKPGIRRVGVLWDYTPPAFPAEEMQQCHVELRKAGAALGVQPHIVQLDAGRSEAAMAELDAARPEALLITSGWSLHEVRQRIMQYSADKRLPTIVDFRWRSLVDPYPLLAYGASQRELMQNAARYVVQILQGAKPGNLPIIQPARFELLVNLKTAKAVGVTVPQTLLLRADEIIR